MPRQLLSLSTDAQTSTRACSLLTGLAPAAAVPRAGAVIAEQEQASVRNLKDAVAGGNPLLRQVVLLQTFAVDIDIAAGEGNLIARQADDALDEELAHLVAPEGHDLAALGYRVGHNIRQTPADHQRF